MKTPIIFKFVEFLNNFNFWVLCNSTICIILLTYVIHILSTNTSLHGGTHHILTVPKLLWIIPVRGLFAVKILHQSICKSARVEVLKYYSKLLHFWSNISNNLFDKFSVEKYLTPLSLREPQYKVHLQHLETVQSTSWSGFWEICPFPTTVMQNST